MSRILNISSLPDAPGCYIFWDSSGDCLYVGKSKRLRSRVRSYFNKHNPPKISKLAKLIARIEYRVAIDEIDALYMEYNLIKTYRPPFNSQMNKDQDLHPHYICIEWASVKPGLYISDRPAPEATRYGGFFSTFDAKEALAVIARAWQLPICEARHFDKPDSTRGCLNLHIGCCKGPCQPDTSPESYRENLLNAAAFMQGKNKQALSAIEREMKQAVVDLDFEKAAKTRDILAELQALQRRFMYRLSFAGRRLCVLIKGHNEPGILMMYFKNGQLRHSARYNGQEDWPMVRDSFIMGMARVRIGKAKVNENNNMYTSAATLEIRARKYYIDVTKASMANLPRRLDKAIKRFTKI